MTVKCADCTTEVVIEDAHDVHDESCHWPADECTCIPAPKLVCFGCCTSCRPERRRET